MSERFATRSRRLFFALWPSPELRARIASEAGEAIRRTGGRPIAARNLHVTLLFLGAVPVERIEAVISAAAELHGTAFELVLDQVETWPDSNVLCLTSRQSPAALIDLSEQLRNRLSVREFEFREQVFHPHVTVARNVPRKRSTAPIAPLHWPVSDFVLVDSNMTKTGSEYAVLARWPLSPPSAQ